MSESFEGKPLSPDALWNQASDLMRGGKTAEAGECFDLVRQAYIANADYVQAEKASERAGECFLAAGKYDSAEEMFDRAMAYVEYQLRAIDKPFGFELHEPRHDFSWQQLARKRNWARERLGDDGLEAADAGTD